MELWRSKSEGTRRQGLSNSQAAQKDRILSKSCGLLDFVWRREGRVETSQHLPVSEGL